MSELDPVSEWIEDACDRRRHVTDAPKGSVLRLPDGLSARYEKMVLADCEAHTADATGDTLILTGDWLFWRRCVKAGWPCLHIETFLRASIFAEVPEADEWRHVMRRVWTDERDPTLFKGVSLGQLTWRDATTFALAYERLRLALEESIRRFAIRRVDALAFHDYYGLVPPAEIHRLLREVAGRHDVALNDRIPDTETQRGPWGRLPQRPRGFKEIVKRLLAKPVAAAFRLRWRLGGRYPTIFLLHNPVVVRPLLEKARDRRTKPLLVFQHWPKTPCFLAANWWRGTILGPRTTPPLDDAEEAALDTMLRTLDARGRDQAPGLDGALWRTLRGRLFTEDAVRKLAIQIKGYRRLFRSWGVARVVIGDATNTECRMAAEVASALNIPVDELPNGIFLCRMHNNARKAEYGERPAVRRGLAWSRRFASIMRQDFDDQPITMTGYPPVPGLRATITPKPGRDHWLVLPILVDGDDVLGLHSNGLTYAVGTVRILNALGHTRCRLKMHPAHGHQVATYRAAMRHFGLNCDIVTGPSLAADLAWADQVVGPVNSGAWVESLSADRDYYPMRAWPSSTDVMAFTAFPVFDSPEHLAEYLRGGETIDRDAMLAELTDWPRINDPSTAFWNAMDDDSNTP